MSVNDTLKTRGSNYGKFMNHASLTQEFKDAARKRTGWARMGPDMREAVDMIFHKIARIINGNAKHADSWHDIQGYARLVEEELTDE